MSAKALGTALKRNCTLKTLRLGISDLIVRIYIDEELLGDKGAKSFVVFLQQNRTLEKLFISIMLAQRHTHE